MGLEFRSPFCSTKRVKSLFTSVATTALVNQSNPNLPERMRVNHSANPSDQREGERAACKSPYSLEWALLCDFLWRQQPGLLYIQRPFPQGRTAPREPALLARSTMGKVGVGHLVLGLCPAAASSLRKSTHVSASFFADHFLRGPGLPRPLLRDHHRLPQPADLLQPLQLHPCGQRLLDAL